MSIKSKLKSIFGGKRVKMPDDEYANRIEEEYFRLFGAQVNQFFDEAAEQMQVIEGNIHIKNQYIDLLNARIVTLASQMQDIARYLRDNGIRDERILELIRDIDQSTNEFLIAHAKFTGSSTHQEIDDEGETFH